MSPGWREGGEDSFRNSYRIKFEDGMLILDINEGPDVLYLNWEQSVDLVAGLAFQMRGFEQRED